jgi:hypothetical protein
MTQDEIIEMAKEAGGSYFINKNKVIWIGTSQTDFLERFAKRVAAKEREACIEACRKTITSQRSAWGANFCIEAIRARGQA